MGRVVLALLLLAGAANGLQFWSMLGREADPCARDLWNVRSEGAVTRNCAQAARLSSTPWAQNTVLIPAQQSHSIQNLVNGNSEDVVVTGLGFNNMGTTAEFCLGAASADPSQWCTTGCDAAFATAGLTVNSDSQITFGLPAANGQTNQWNTEAVELETMPRPLCLRQTAATTAANTWSGFTAGTTTIWSGFMVATVWHCDDSVTSQRCENRNTNNFQDPVAQRQVISRTACCAAPSSATGNTLFAVGSCYNPNVESCCHGVAYDKGTAKCCTPAASNWITHDPKPALAFVDGHCPCYNASNCPSSEGSCCRASKYSEMSDSSNIGDRSRGQCYDGVKSACCNTGHVYDPGTYRCCAINGIQSRNERCPCGSDTDCIGNGDVCCRSGNTIEGSTECNVYANYPTGSTSKYANRCLGACMTANYEICCNGAVCQRNFELCCNSTCCNRYDGSCLYGTRNAAPGFPRNNIDHFNSYVQCSQVEALTPPRAFRVFVLPIALLLATLLALSLVLVFANKASARTYSFIERALITFSVLSILLSCLVFFSPAFKYGVIAVVASLVAILTAAARLRWLNLFAIVVLGVAVLYMFDPFYGNFWFTAASNRFENGNVNAETSGILHTIGANWRSVTSLGSCTKFYDYFMLDTQLTSYGYDNPMDTTFGLCSRSWTLFLLFVAGFLVIFLLLAFILSMLALIVRFRKQRFEPIELEVRGVQPGDEDFVDYDVAY
eukprot:NODE_95_length_2339_cov_140.324593_g74_i0.p1 GENE.NODE_95_length_2339_cov_140.324593_g74_i0~~NODE_95_length_2339_cov_140.324593_g74_i0.p1  ORF type:complete len:725 (+),score=202.27 NODE_95_length_2339_cov_140.324593_g74_i0:58-2232(+)